jgi:hypothetical protein
LQFKKFLQVIHRRAVSGDGDASCNRAVAIDPLVNPSFRARGPLARSVGSRAVAVSVECGETVRATIVAERRTKSPDQADEGKAAEYQERAQALRENAKGILDDKTRRELLRQADECAAIAAALVGKRDKARK